MFDTTEAAAEVVDLAGLPIRELGARVEQNGATVRQAEAQGLVLAAAWADAHDRLTEGPFSPQVERSCFYGGKGTPMVAEFCAAEFAALQRLPYHQGRAMIADALDLRHRLPLLWRQTVAGEVRGWKAQKIAQATRELTAEAAADVDAAIGGLVESVAWSRFQRILAAAVLEADPELAAERAERARTAREVWLSDSEDGLKTLIARLDAGDGLLFLAAVNRIADILQARGDIDPVGPRRAKAVGLLARPAEAAALLAAHRHDPEPAQSGAPGGPEPAPDVDLDDALLDDLDPETPEYPEPDAPQPAPVSDPAGPPVDDEFDDETAPVPDPEVRAEDAHTTLDLGSPFGRLCGKELRAARPRVVLYFHLSDAAVRDGHGVVRLEGGEPLTLDQLRDWLAQTGCVVQVRPVSIPANTEPVDGYEIPGPSASGGPTTRHRRHLPVGQLHGRHYGPRPHRVLPGPRRRRATGPDRRRHPRAADQDAAPGRHLRRLAETPTRSRAVRVAITARLDLPGHQPRHPRAGPHRIRARRVARRHA